MQEDKKDTKQKVKLCSISELFMFAEKNDKILVIIGGLVALVNGFVYPIFTVIFGDMTNAFSNPDPNKRLEVALENSIKFFVVGAVAFILSFVQFSTFMISATRQTVLFRKAYFQALIRQDVGWHDKVNANELGSRVSNDAVQIQNAIGEKFGTLVMFVTMFLGGIGVGFYKGWLMSVILFAALPFVSLGAIFMIVSIAQGQTKINNQNRQSGAIVEEYIQNIKTVKSLVAENFIIDRFKKVVLDSQGPLNRFNLMIGLGLGSMFFFLFLDYALCFYVGSELVGNKVINDNNGKVYNVGDVMTIFFSIMIGGFALGQAGPAAKAITQGRLSMQNYLEVLQQKPTIIQNDPTKKKDFQIQGSIELNDVVFQYPTKKQDQGLNVLQNVSIKFLQNKKNSIVGESGSGKSTIMQLIERYYDCDQGQLIIDGLDIKDYNLKELRQQIGYVGQEPVLFNTTIRQNLQYGRETATQEEMIDALRQANAWEFVSKTEKGLDTEVGQSGSNFSGGQKQRIAIARAILKKPKILLLDEATSALDKQNEMTIQQTLDQISQNITTITIAHRLSTIINSDMIFVIDKGHLVQQGTHEQLNSQIGKYKSLVALQNVGQEQGPIDTVDNMHVADERNYTSKNKQIDTQIVKTEVNNLVDQDDDIILNKEARQQKEKEQEQLKKKQEKEAVDMVNKRLAQFKSKMRDSKTNGLIVLGLLLSTCYGMTMPVTGYLLSEFIGETSSPGSSQFKDNVIKITIYMVLISIAILITQGLGHYVHSIAGQTVTDKLKMEAFEVLIQQRLCYFDKKENAPGVLSSSISQDSQQINSLVSVLYGVIVSALSSFILGIILAFIASPRIAGIAFALSPLMIIAGAVEAQMAQGFSGKVDAKFKQGSSVINETFCNIRTILSFSNELFVQNLYSSKIEASVTECYKNGVIAGIAFGFSQFAQFLMYGVIFYCGAIFINEYGLSISDMFTAMFAIMFAAFATGNANQYLPDYGKMISSAKTIFEIIDMKTEPMHMQEIQQQVNINYDIIKGDIEFIDVSFKYPERKQYVFKNLSIKINCGQKAALVGPSGCGKSTIFQLLLRFYEPEEGQILLDGINIRDYDIDKLRKMFGVVSQEPVLFSGSVLYNVKFNTNCSQEEIDSACKYANAYDFVVNDDFDIDDNNRNGDKSNEGTDNKGFNRKVGIKGSQISGGQKQRLAIARAILKDPLILLLDEATSALDSNNEKMVQESLDRIMSQKTTIVIAHRISTIVNSEIIYMFSEGKIVEQGTYQQLMDKKAYFFKFQQGSI